MRAELSITRRAGKPALASELGARGEQGDMAHLLRAHCEWSSSVVLAMIKTAAAAATATATAAKATTTAAGRRGRDLISEPAPARRASKPRACWTESIGNSMQRRRTPEAGASGRLSSAFLVKFALLALSLVLLVGTQSALHWLSARHATHASAAPELISRDELPPPPPPRWLILGGPAPASRRERAGSESFGAQLQNDASLNADSADKQRKQFFDDRDDANDDIIEVEQDLAERDEESAREPQRLPASGRPESRPFNATSPRVVQQQQQQQQQSQESKVRARRHQAADWRQTADDRHGAALWRRSAPLASSSQQHGKPILNEFSFPANLIQGMRFVLMCQVLDGEPPIQIKWLKDRQELAGAHNSLSAIETGAGEPVDVEMISNDELGSSLLFRKVRLQHGGNYTCLASNHLGAASYSALMTVKVPPNWRVEPQDRECMLGEQVTIDCQADGWKFSSLGQQQQQAGAATEPAALAGAFKLINSNHHVQTLENGSLAIRQIGREHEGSYACEADNGVEPSLAKLIRLVVHKQAHFFDDIQVLSSSSAALAAVGAGQPPASEQVVGGVRSARLAQNSTGVRLVCAPHGDAPLQIDWLKDGRLLHTWSSMSSPSPSSSSSSSSVSPSVAAADSAGEAGAQLAGRALHASARWLPQRAHFESELALHGQLARQDAGLYACQARNSFGQAERKLRLVVQEPPEAPQLVDVAHVSSRSIGLRWSAPFDGNSAIIKYVIEWRRQAPAHQLAAAPPDQEQRDGQPVGRTEKPMPLQQQPAAGQTLQHSVHELEPLTRYSMRVFAVNSLGQSRPSVALSLQTEEEVPSTVPNLVGASVLGSRAVKLHWSITYAPEHELIDGFFIGYRSFDGAPQELKSRPADAERPTFTYKTIRLATGEARPADSPAPGADSPGSGSGPALLAPVSSVASKARAPAAPNGALLRQSQFEYVVSGLERNTEYTVLIQCFNRKGAGPTSDPVVFRTFASDPPDKLLASAEPLSKSALRVSWRFRTEQADAPPPLPASLQQQQLQHAPVDGFVLAYARLPRALQFRPHAQLAGAPLAPAARILAQPAEPQPNSAGAQLADQLQWQAVQLAPLQRSYSLKNLDCGTWYATQVWAFNKMGKGEPSDLVTASTHGTAPVAPSPRSFLQVNSSQARLHLSAWHDGGCAIDKFVVQYRARRPPGQQQNQWTLVSDSIAREQQMVTVRDLSPGSAYELLVGAHNSVDLTEYRYRFTTLDVDGKEVATSVEPDEARADDAQPRDYMDEAGAIQQQQQQQQQLQQALRDGATSSALWFLTGLRQFLNSPLTLLLALCLLLVVLLFLLFNRFAVSGQSAHQNAPSGSSATPSNPFKGCAQQLANSNRRCSHDATTATILDASSEPPLSVTNGSSSLTDVSPVRVNLAGSQRSTMQLVVGSNCSQQGYATPLVDCAAATGGAYCRAGQIVLEQQKQLETSVVDAAAATNYAIAPGYGSSPGYGYAPAPTNYATVQRSATIDNAVPSHYRHETQHQHHQQQPVQQTVAGENLDDRQEYLMQMLMATSSQHQHQNTNNNSNNNNGFNSASATWSRCGNFLR